MNEMKIWNATYLNRVMPPTKVLAADAEGARKAAIAAYRYNSHMDTGKPAGDVVDSVELAEDQSVFGGTLLQPVSQFPPEPAPAMDGENEFTAGKTGA